MYTVCLHDVYDIRLTSLNILQDVEDPFYVVDLGRLIELYQDWVTAMPSVTPFYAVKCNEDPALLKTLAALGTGFDCASKVRPLAWFIACMDVSDLHQCMHV